MQSGIDAETELRRISLPLVERLPGVGQKLQDDFQIFRVVLPNLQILQTDGSNIKTEMSM